MIGNISSVKAKCDICGHTEGMGLIVKFFKFGLVGFSGLLVDFGLTYLFKEVLKVQKFLANAIGFMSAASSNYVLNRIWTFESTNPDVAGEYGKFIFVSAAGLGINSLVLWVLNEKFKLNFYFAKLLAIAVTTFWNFAANYLYTFTA